jgi:flagellar hook-associated protein 3 FlgL
MRIAGTNSTESIIRQIGILQQQQNKYNNQLSTGLRVDKSSDDPGAMSAALTLSAENARAAQFSSNITTLQSKATTASSAMSSIKDIITRAEEIATQVGSTANAQDLEAYSVEVDGLIQQAVALGNTKNGSAYLFGGTAANTQPFAVTTDASGKVSAVTYQGNSNTALSEIASGTLISSDQVGENTSGSGPRGTFSDSRYGADLFGHLISLASHLRSGDTASIVSGDSQSLSKDEDNIIYQISSNNVSQTRLESAATSASTQAENINTALTNEVGSDTISAATALSSAQSTYQAALQASSIMLKMNKTLVDYLG